MKTGVSYFQPRDPRHAESDLDEMVEIGCDFVVHCFSETDMAYYNQAMEKIIRMSKDRGLEVYLDPWGFGGLYGGESFSKFAAENPAACQATRSGKHVPAACPNHPDFGRLQEFWISRAAELGADVCFWDEPHFHFHFSDPDSWEDWCCRCEVCQDKFQKQYGEAMPASMTDAVEKFRQDSLVTFLQSNCRQARKLGMRNAVCVLPDEGEEGMGRAAGTASWERIASMTEIDIFGTDPYWVLFGGEVEQVVSKHCRRVVELCQRYDKEAQAWVQAFLIPEDREMEVEKAIDVMVDSGIANIAAWGYRGCHLIDIKCARPELVWEILAKSFRKIRAE